MPGPAVLLSHVGKTYHEGDSERIVLRDVSVAIAPGEIAVLVGRSGSGKSTLLQSDAEQVTQDSLWAAARKIDCR
jgi:putative ABC transport system ATP-binding protein